MVARILVLIVSIPAIATLGFALAAQVARAPVEVRVPVAPTPVAGTDGHAHLAYELHVTNFYRSTGALLLERIDIFDDSNSVALQSHTGVELEGWVVHPGANSGGNGRGIAAGMRVIVYVWLTLPRGQAIPHSLRHRLLFLNEEGRAESVDGIRIETNKATPVVLGPPLRGGIWLAHEGPGNHRSHHWGSQLASNGRVTIPQRFAIDLIGLDGEGTALKGDFLKSSNEDWLGFGKEVLAATAGVIRDVQDGIADNQPLAQLEAPATLTAPALYGNYVVIEAGPKIFLHYAHLQHNSVRVGVGQHVRRGQVIGRVGNSGNSSGPHLHLHVSDAATFENSEGLPFVFESFEALGKSTAARAIGAEIPEQGLDFSSDRRLRELPLHGAVIRFF